MTNLLKQLRQLWAQFGLNQRVSIVLATLLVIAGMVALTLWARRSQMQLLYGRLGEKDVAEVVAALQEQGVPYELSTSGNSIYVPDESVHKVRMQLAIKGVPAGDGVGFEIFDRTNFGISDFVQRTNYARALQGELGRTISQLHGVRSARVMIVMPESRLLFADQKAKPTASVFIDHGNGALTAEGVSSIQFLVANAVENLRPADVAVVDSHGNVLTKDLGDDPALTAASGQMKYRRSVEDYFASKVETMLSTVLGPGNAVVRVSAEIDTEGASKTEERFDPDGQVVRTETSTNDTTTTTETEGDNKQGTGITANIPSVGNSAAAKTGKNSEQARKNRSQTYEINKTVLNSVKSPGAVTRLTAAVFIAPKDNPRDANEVASLRRMIANALGVKAATDKEIENLVTIQELPFHELAKPAEKSFTDFISPELIRNAAGVLITAAVFLAFLRLLKRTEPDEIPIEILDPSKREVKEEPVKAVEITPELLNEMIREKPAHIGAALRGWMAAPSQNGKG